MADQTVNVKIVVDGAGNIKEVRQSAKQAAKGLDETAKSARTADRNLKGTARTSSNTTKNFSKMSQGMGGLVGAYATLAANVFAISAAFNFLKSAGDLAALQRGQVQFAARTGKSLELLTGNIERATGGLIGFQDAAQATAIGTAAGLGAEQLQGLGRVAKNASVALGRDLTDSFNRLTRGAIKAEPELLDELGIIIRLDRVTGDYARSIGKTAKELTTFEKTQAVVNAVLEQGDQKFKDVGNNVNEFARLGKAFDDLMKKIKLGIEGPASFIASVFAENVNALAAAFSLLGVSLTKALMPAGPNIAALSERAADARRNVAGAINTDSAMGARFDLGTSTQADFKHMAKAHDQASSKIVNTSKITKQALIRDLRLISLEQQRVAMSGQTGFQRMFTRISIHVKSMVAQYGIAMGSMMIATQALVSGVNLLMSGIAIIGTIYLIISLIKQMKEQSKTLFEKDIAQKTKLLNEQFEAQLEKLPDAQRNLEDFTGSADRFLKLGRLFGNFNFGGLDGLIENLRDVDTVTKDVFETVTTQYGTSLRKVGTEEVINMTEANEKLLGTITRATQTMEEQQRMATDYGLSFPVEQAGNLKEVLEALEVTQLGTNATQKDMNDAFATLRKIFPQLTKQAIEFDDALQKQVASINEVSQIGERYSKFVAKLGETPTKFEEAFKSFNELSDILASFEGQQNETLKDFFAGAPEIEASTSDIFKFLQGIDSTQGEINYKNIENITLQEATKLLAARIKTIKEAEFKIEEQKLIRQKEFLQATRGATPLAAKRLKLENDYLKVIDEIGALKEQEIIDGALGVTQSGALQTQEKLRLDILKEQKLALEDQLNYSKQIEQSIRNAAEAGTQGFFSKLFRGETSGKEALKESLKTFVGKAADDAARMVTEQIFLKTKTTEELAAQGFSKQNTVLGATNELGKQFDNFKTFFEKLVDGSALRVTLSKAGPTPTDDPTGTGKAVASAIKKAEASKKPMTRQEAIDAGIQVSTATAGTDAVMDEVITTGTGGSIPFISALKNNAQDVLDGTSNLQEGFTNLLSDFGADFRTTFEFGSDLFDGVFTKMGSLFTGFGGVLQRLISSMASGGSLINTIIQGAVSGMFGHMGPGGSGDGGGERYGGMLSSPGFRYGGRTMYSTGGIARGSQAGYPAILHGAEAVVPLPDGKKIPVTLKGGMGQQNNINITITNSGGGTQTQMNSTQADSQSENLGRAISAAVQKELQNQKRAGGILSPYGVA